MPTYRSWKTGLEFWKWRPYKVRSLVSNSIDAKKDRNGPPSANQVASKRQPRRGHAVCTLRVHPPPPPLPPPPPPLPPRPPPTPPPYFSTPTILPVWRSFLSSTFCCGDKLSLRGWAYILQCSKFSGQGLRHWVIHTITIVKARLH